MATRKRVQAVPLVSAPVAVMPADAMPAADAMPPTAAAARSQRVTCQRCGTSVLAGGLKKHIRAAHEVCDRSPAAAAAIAARSRRVACGRCGKSILAKGLKRHIRTVHEQCDKLLRDLPMTARPPTAVPPTPSAACPRRVACEQCGKVILASNYKRHIRMVHGRREDHICPHCEKAFTRLKGLRAHIRRLHERHTASRAAHQTWHGVELEPGHKMLVDAECLKLRWQIMERSCEPLFQGPHGKTMATTAINMRYDEAFEDEFYKLCVHIEKNGWPDMKDTTIQRCPAGTVPVDFPLHYQGGMVQGKVAVEPGFAL